MRDSWERREGHAFAYSGLELPGFPGKCECRVGCRCSWEIVDHPDKWVATWRTTKDHGVCDGCEQRGREWVGLE